MTRFAAIVLISCSRIVCGHLAAEGLCGSTPYPDWILPSEENYEKEYRAFKTGRLYNPLHVIPLGDRNSDAYLSVGGQQRQWFESFNTAAFGNGPDKRNSYLLQRYMLHFDAHVNRRVRVFVEFKGTLENGRAGGPRPEIDEDRGDINQAFAEIALPAKPESNFFLRLGRQELVLGSGRQIDIREGVNVRLSFDGARLSYCGQNWRADAFALRPVTNLPSAFDNRPIHGTTLAGVYGTRKTPGLLRGNIDAYYIAFDKKRSVFVRGAGHEQRHTVGTRFWKTGKGWDYDLELMDQFGRFGPTGIQAWSAGLNTGYTFPAHIKPRLGFKADVASGDSGVDKNNLGTFHPPFASLHYFGEEGTAGPMNFYDIRPEFAFQAHPTLRLQLSADWFWRQRLTDGIYLPGPALLVTPGGSRARYITNQNTIEAIWQPTMHWSTTAYWSHYFNGEFLQQATKSRNLDYVAGWVTFHF